MGKRLEINIISKYRQEIYGLAALWVLLSHVSDYQIINFNIFGKYADTFYGVFARGNISVDIFLFLSGISLYYAWQKNSDIDDFYTSRVKRILPSYLIIMFAAGLIQIIFKLGVKPVSYLLALSGVQIFIDGARPAPWYASCIAVFYLIFPAIYVFIYGKKSKNHFLRFIFLILFAYGFIYSMHRLNVDYYNKVEIIINRLPVFITGIYAGKFVKKGVTFNPAMWIVFFALAALCTYLRIHLHVWYYRVPNIIGAIPLTFLFAGVFKLIDRKNAVSQAILKGLRKIGDVSFEFYLTHFLFVRLFASGKGPFGLWFVALMVVFATVTSILARKAAVAITSKNFGKKKIKEA